MGVIETMDACCSEKASTIGRLRERQASTLRLVLYKLIHPQVPTVGTMGAVGALALAANGVCFALLWRHRAEDINMRSV